MTKSTIYYIINYERCDKMNKKIFLLILAVIFVIIPFTKVEAKTLGNLKDELKELEKKTKRGRK